MNELFPDAEQALAPKTEAPGLQQQLQQARAVQARQQQAARPPPARAASSADAAALARRQAALLNPQFVAAVRQKLQSPDFRTLPADAQQKLLQLRQQIQRAAVLQQQLQRSNGRGPQQQPQQPQQPPQSTAGAAAQAAAAPAAQAAALQEQRRLQLQQKVTATAAATVGGQGWGRGLAGTAVGARGGGGSGSAVAPPPFMPLAPGTVAAGGAAVGGVYTGGQGQQKGATGGEVAVGVKREREAPGESAVLAPTQESKGERHKRMLVSYMKDTQRALRPDYRTPFSSSEDVCQRLLAYHKFSQTAGRTDAAIKADLEAWKEEYPKKCEALLPRLQAVAKVDISSSINNAASGTPEEGYLAAILERYEAAQHLKEVRAKMGAAQQPSVQQSQQTAGQALPGQTGLQQQQQRQLQLQQQLQLKEQRAKLESAS